MHLNAWSSLTYAQLTTRHESVRAPGLRLSAPLQEGARGETQLRVSPGAGGSQVRGAAAARPGRLLRGADIWAQTTGHVGAESVRFINKGQTVSK